MQPKGRMRRALVKGKDLYIGQLKEYIKKIRESKKIEKRRFNEFTLPASYKWIYYSSLY